MFLRRPVRRRGHEHGDGGVGDSGAGSAASALLTAATQAQTINSAVTTLHIQVTGSQASAQTGTLQYQRTRA